MRSFRFRLTVWNTAVLLIVLVSFGATSAVLTEQAVVRNIDRDLADAAERFRMPAPGRMFQERGPAPPRDTRRLDGDPYGPRWIAPDAKVVEPGDRPILSAQGFLAAVNNDVDVRTEEIEGRSVRVMSVRREAPREGPVVPWQVVQFGRDLTDAQSALAQQRAVMVFMLPIGLLVAAIGGMFLVNRALKPVEDVTKAAERIGADDLSTRLDVKGDDELANLARTFNSMIGRLQGSFESLEESYEAQKRFVADASHELRTPLSRIKLVSSASLTQDSSETERREALQTIDRTADEMARLVEGLLQLARSESGAIALQQEPIELNKVVSEAIAQLPDARRVRFSPNGPAHALGDEDAVRRVVVNLLTNALRHSPNGNTVTVIATSGRVTVTDEGEGISPADIERVKERFYRVDSSRTRASGGAGLGLAICDALARAMEGSLDIESELGLGTKVTLALPTQSN